jgi:hypothetical protein
MGNCASASDLSSNDPRILTKKSRRPNKSAISKQRFATWAECLSALSCVESSNIIIAVDHSDSNATNGRESFDGKSLHHLASQSDFLSPHLFNPYQQALSCIIDGLVKRFDDDGDLLVYGYADSTTSNKHVFGYNDFKPCRGKREVLYRYHAAVRSVVMGGPTNFAPMIREVGGTLTRTPAGGCSFPPFTKGASR